MPCARELGINTMQQMAGGLDLGDMQNLESQMMEIMDGEDGGERERVTVQCVPGAVSFSVGARDPELSLGDLTEPVTGA